MISQVIINVDSALKAKAMKKAKREGIAFSTVLKMAIKAFVEDKFNVGLIGDFNAETSRKIKRAIKDIKKGKNLSPRFSTVAEMRKYLAN
jgi:antitoxin component of RelBE/YafQ-DinJ toxin-antitoxin module